MWGNTIFNEKQTILRSIEFTELLIWYSSFLNSEYSHVISVWDINIYVSTGLKFDHSCYN